MNHLRPGLYSCTEDEIREAVEAIMRERSDYDGSLIDDWVEYVPREHPGDELPDFGVFGKIVKTVTPDEELFTFDVIWRPEDRRGHYEGDDDPVFVSLEAEDNPYPSRDYLTINGRGLSETDAAVLSHALTITHYYIKNDEVALEKEGEEIPREEIMESLENIAAAKYDRDDVRIVERQGSTE